MTDPDLVVIGILIFIFIYMLIVKPDGNLTVTYAIQKKADPPNPPEVAPTVPAPLAARYAEASPDGPSARPLTERLTELDRARQERLITAKEYEAKRHDILDQF